jgi:hypothetical protein
MSKDLDPVPDHLRAWRRAGAVLQGLILGSLVTVAILNLLRVASDAQIFRYQGF